MRSRNLLTLIVQRFGRFSFSHQRCDLKDAFVADRIKTGFSFDQEFCSPNGFCLKVGVFVGKKSGTSGKLHAQARSVSIFGVPSLNKWMLACLAAGLFQLNVLEQTKDPKLKRHSCGFSVVQNISSSNKV